MTVQAAHSKRRRTDAQPIRRDLAEALREWLAGKAERESLFAKLPHDTAKMLRRDLKAARAAWIEEAANDAERTRREQTDFLAYENAAREVLDFHSFRHSYISSIVNGGASVKVAQELARHSTPTLTIGRYAHTRLHDLRGALESLPSNAAGDGASNEQPLRATGTDDQSLPTERETTYDARTGQHIGGWNGGEKGPNVAKEGETLKSPKAEVGNRNLLALNKLGSQGRTPASLGLSTPTGIRTPVNGLRTRRPRPLDDRGVLDFASSSLLIGGCGVSTGGGPKNGCCPSDLVGRNECRKPNHATNDDV